MATPSAERGVTPSIRARQSFWSRIGRRGRANLTVGIVLTAVWLVEAVPPFFSSSHVVGVCARSGCIAFPSGDFVLGEVLLALFLLGMAVGSFSVVIRAARPQSGRSEGGATASIRKPEASDRVSDSNLPPRAEAGPELGRVGTDGPTPQSFILSNAGPADEHWWSRSPATRLRIDQAGFSIDYADGRSVAVRWNEPNLRLRLSDLTAPARRKSWNLTPYGRKHPYQISYGSTTWDTASLSEEAFKAFDAAASSAGLPREEWVGMAGRGPPDVRHIVFGTRTRR